jgi:hypothetical protein
VKLRNAYYHSGEKTLFPSLLSKNIKITIHRGIILPVVLYGCETLSLPLREERTLRLFEKRTLRRMLVPKNDEVTGEWRKLHNEELNGLYSPNIIPAIKSRRMRWKGHAARMGDRRGVYRILVENAEGPEVEPGVNRRIILK